MKVSANFHAISLSTLSKSIPWIFTWKFTGTISKRVDGFWLWKTDFYSLRQLSSRLTLSPKNFYMEICRNWQIQLKSANWKRHLPRPYVVSCSNQVFRIGLHSYELDIKWETWCWSTCWPQIIQPFPPPPWNHQTKIIIHHEVNLSKFARITRIKQWKFVRSSNEFIILFFMWFDFSLWHLIAHVEYILDYT